MNQKILNSILVKPAGPDCNMACDYCFYLKKSEIFPGNPKHRMSDEVLEILIKQVMIQSGPQVSIGWQGGEPTLMGLAFFQKAVKFQEQYGKGKEVGNGLQTNGLLLDASWADFLREYKFLIGLSLDGPEHIHNHYRRRIHDYDTWETVQKNGTMLLSRGVEVNALCCVTDYSVNYPEELYHYYKNLGLTWMQFIPVQELEPTDPSKIADYSVPSVKYGEFLCALFDCWHKDFVNGKPVTSIRFFESVFFSYVGYMPPQCTMHPECGIYVVVEHDGSVYSCDFFVESQWRLGNIKNHSLLAMLNSKKQEKFGKLKSKLPTPCNYCEWLRYCQGGCPKDRQHYPPSYQFPFCESYKMFFQHADDTLNTLAEAWKKNRNHN